tara:strand:+ start:9000 stop:9155 length:156 start_codon:yes stop_codon:yes gene_type:complete
MAKELSTCWICLKTIRGIPNNADPVSIGVCCDKCNRTKVIPARLEKIKNEI